ncbi:hypothetical protein [Streptomyces sp. URMC 129]|uniref:hypothetical protein n=1 Tax=Streptomyces sp. URMC 129 TaxID=3423407 RepID=UPI003F1A7D9D
MDALVVAQQAAPYITAAVGAYGTAAPTRAADAGVDSTVSVGQRLLRRIRHREESRDGIEEAVRDLAEAPEDEDFQAVLRARVRRALLDDPELTADLARLLPPAAGGTAFIATGAGAVAVQENSGIISTGDQSTITRR